MPELPEVESVRRQLEPELTGRRVLSVWWDAHPHARLSDVHLVEGCQILQVHRRGKFLVLPLETLAGERNLELVLHLGMTGSFRIVPIGSSEPADDLAPPAPPAPTAQPAPPAPPEEGVMDTDLAPERALEVDASDPARTRPEPKPADQPVSHVRASFVLDDERVLLFRDPRRFGRVSVVPAGEYAGRIPTLASLGPEPLTEDFDVTDFAAALSKTSAPVKAKLLDQKLVAGVGNIYADEALWLARIHPASRRVGAARAALLHRAIREVLSAAIEREGTTFRDYQMVNGESGRNADFLAAYGQGDLPCQRCGTPMRRTVIAQRGTTYCPSCQRS